MAYNDYEVITYKILKYLYDCLKEDDDIERIRLTREYYDVPRKYWEFILCNLIECGFVSGIIASNTKDGYVFSGFMTR